MKKPPLKIAEGQTLHDFQKEGLGKIREHLSKAGTVIIKIPDRIGKREVKNLNN